MNTHTLSSAERGTSQNAERKRASQGHLRTVKERGRDESQHRKKVSMQEDNQDHSFSHIRSLLSRHFRGYDGRSNACQQKPSIHSRKTTSDPRRPLKASGVVRTFYVDRVGLASTKEDGCFHLSWLSSVEVVARDDLDGLGG
jgi:hypothetical protein